MRAIILALNVLWCIPLHGAQGQDSTYRYLFIGAHPDDADLKAGGTAALLAQNGHAVKFLSVTNGDAGHFEQSGGVLARRRRAEAEEAGKRLGIAYEVLDFHDGELLPTLEARHAIIRAIREWKADVVASHRPNDYHPDHRYTGVLVQDAAILVQVPNIVTSHPALQNNPVFLYFEDGFQKPNPFTADIAIDVSAVYDLKMLALDAHVSQFHEFLPRMNDDMGMAPQDDKPRIEWLKLHWTYPVSETVRESLAKWYGADIASNAHYTEAFEIAEYGHQPGNDEIRKLFPMLP
ncbi:MAG: PIG-L family deacetylase [Rhodothermia bacterium]|nr:PIG-L family deacetylase [Rhodothermia bacterium]